MGLTQGIQEGPRYIDSVFGNVVSAGSPVTSTSGVQYNIQLGTAVTTGSAAWVSFNEKYAAGTGSNSVFVFTQAVGTAAVAGSVAIGVGSIGPGSFYVYALSPSTVTSYFNWMAIGPRA